ncbi:phosphotransferase [Nocardioides donggukensis]|uniref:Phosphotransferase n=1 Tax=Nocardioides donggukensis TaxID=2774019 RepID=A0A927K2Z8_9ACTN|nr:phosphotransferase [Nocardioides donggukensis]MBD8869409.1 phosphotransferase [Nocardioides donggukensis]
MWQPEPGWQALRAGAGPSTVGVWAAGETVVKRVAAPLPGDPPELSRPGHFAYWRRPVDVALHGTVEATLGLRGPAALSVVEDDEGATLVHPRLEAGPAGPPTGPFAARALGRFAGCEVPDLPWLARGQLADRLSAVERRGGWGTLARTTVADVADALWSRRTSLLGRLAELPQVLQHGDPVPANLVRAEGEDVLALDWSTLGSGPVGGDAGYWTLSAREGFEVLVAAYCSGLPAGLASAEQVLLGARVTAVLTALTRADWALARVAGGEGALAGKYRHPSVAPYLRSLQRLLPEIEALLDG